MTATDIRKTQRARTKPLEWTATEPADRLGTKPLTGLILIAVFGTIALLLIRELVMVLLLLSIITLTLIVYLRKPRTWRYRLDGSQLYIVREPRRGNADDLRVDLSKLQEVTGYKRNRVLRLEPVADFGVSVDIYLPRDRMKAERVSAELVSSNLIDS